MAIRSKTIEYPLGQVSDIISSASLYTHPTSTMLYIAETGSRVIRNAFIEIFWRDRSTLTTNRPSVNTQSLFLQLGNNKVETSSLIILVPDTGEQVSFVSGYDVTSYFSSSFGNDISQSLQWQFRYTVNPPSQSYTMVGLYPQLYITYTYDDNNASIRSKTATIPLNFSGSLNAERLIDFIPALDTYCTESNKTFDSIWCEVEGGNMHTTTTTYSMSYHLDNNPPTESFEIVNPNGTGTWIKWLLNLNETDTSVPHNLGINNSITTALHSRNMVTLKATYRYNHDNSNYILNTPSIAMNETVARPWFNVEGTDVACFDYCDFNIQEPEPIIQGNCAFRIFTGYTATVTLQVHPATGSLVNCGLTQASVEACSAALQIRFDSGSGSTTFTNEQTTPLVRGNNRFALGYGSADVQRLSSLGTHVLLNYISGKDPRGDGVHAHTLTEMAATSSILPVYDGINNQYGRCELRRPSIYDTNYHIHGWCLDSTFFGSAANLTPFITAIDNITTNSSSFQYSVTDVKLLYSSDSENGVFRMIFPFNNYYTKFPNSVKRKNELGDLPFIRTVGARSFLKSLMTYDSIFYTITGSISGYTGDGSGILVDCIESGSEYSNEGKIFQTITAVGGTFSGSVYDNTKKYYVTARQSSTLTSRSDDATGSVIIV